MYKILATTVIFLSLAFNVFAANIIKGEIYQNHIDNAFGTKMTVSLPPGKWKVAEVNKRNLYTTVRFDNNIDSALFIITIPNTIISGDYFRTSGVSKCKNKNNNGDKYKVHATGLIRNTLQVSYCIEDIDFVESGDWLHIGLQAIKKKGNPLMWASYDVYYPQKFSNINILNKEELMSIGKSLIKVFENNVRGNKGDYTLATKLLNYTNTSSSSNSVNTSSLNKNKLEGISDGLACRKATSLDGMKWEIMDSKFGDYVAEVFRRNLSLEECRRITGRKLSNAKITNSTDITSKLKVLKAMLDAGLINQDQYDTKSSELLKGF